SHRSAALRAGDERGDPARDHRRSGGPAMSELRLRDRAAAWLAEGKPAVVVEIVAVRGSVPRGVGTRMLVGVDSALGTIGGGHLELKAISAARAALASGHV